MKNNEYQCYVCKNIYIKIISDEECWKEFFETLPDSNPHDAVEVCDDCYLEIMDQFNKLSPEEKKKAQEDWIRENYN